MKQEPISVRPIMLLYKLGGWSSKSESTSSIHVSQMPTTNKTHTKSSTNFDAVNALEMDIKECVECTIHLSIYTSALSTSTVFVQRDQTPYPEAPASSSIRCSLLYPSPSGTVCSNSWLRLLASMLYTGKSYLELFKHASSNSDSGSCTRVRWN
jgi:hypothetical protein